MKNKSFIGLFSLLLGLGASTTSCEDMLTPDMDRYAENFTGRDTVNFYLGILANVQDLIENNVILGEVRGDMVSPTSFVSDTVSKAANFEKVIDADNGLFNRSAYYKVINQCNFYLSKVDTMAMKNNIYYMRKEFAQVQMIRAWTYMQLVQNYGRVPYIVDPVDNADTGWETTPPGKLFADADNLLELLEKDGLAKAYNFESTLGYPNYGTFKTGAVSISHRQTLFPGDLVLGDLYLLRGKDTTDYKTAASYYYNYLEKNKLNVKEGFKASFRKNTIGDKDYYHAMEGSWTSAVVGLTSNDGAITLVPSAANSSLGTTLTRVQQMYGFDPRSSNSTSGGEESVVSGNISITANYKNRQLGPSQGYINLCKSQIVSDPEMNAGVQIDVEYPENLGDCRIDGAFKYVQTLGGRLPFVQKFGARTSNNENSLTNFSFRYALPVYRVNQVYLRYAEAINRAGYPRYAFSVLRNGLNHENVPALRYDSVVFDDVKKITYKNIPYVGPVADGNFCIDKHELYEASKEQVNGIKFLDFSEPQWTNYGVHELGCGKFTDMDTLYTYDLTVLGKGWDKLDKIPEFMNKADLIGRVQQEKMRMNAYNPAPATLAMPLADTEEGEGEEEEEVEPDRSDYTVISVKDNLNSTEVQIPDSLKIPAAPADLQEQINAVETLIADEMALETAFEGWRYYDLYRIARHKEKAVPGSGIEWFAWIVSRRDLQLKSYENPSQRGPLYNRLLNQNNWYLMNPGEKLANSDK